MNQQDQDFNYFLENMEQFYHTYGQKFVVVKNQNILAVYDNFMDAYETTLKTEEPGTFLIQECFDDEEKMVSHFQFQTKIFPVRAGSAWRQRAGETAYTAPSGLRVCIRAFVIVRTERGYQAQ